LKRQKKYTDIRSTPYRPLWLQGLQSKQALSTAALLPFSLAMLTQRATSGQDTARKFAATLEVCREYLNLK